MDTFGAVGLWTSLAVSGTTVSIAYYEDYNYNLRVAQSTNAGSTWSMKQVVDSGGVGLYASIVDTGSQLFVSYYDFVNQDLKVAGYSEDAWTLY